MDGDSWYCSADRNQDHPQVKEMQKSKMAVWGGLTNSCEKKRSKKQRRKGKICPFECRVPKNSKKRYESLPQWSMQRNRGKEENGKEQRSLQENQRYQGNISCKVKVSESESRSVVPNSLQPRGLFSPWNSPGQNTGVGSLSFLQGIFPTQRSNLGLPHYRQMLEFMQRWAQ